MENNEIMNENYEVTETNDEEIVETSSCNGLKVAGGICLLAAAGFGAYKLGKRIVAKIKAKREQKRIESEEPVYELVEDDDENVES